MSIIWSNPVNRLHPLNRGIVSWWLVTPNARGGTTFRDLAGHNHGTLTLMDPATDWVASNRHGAFGALDFDGVDGYVALPSNIVNVGTENVSAFSWVRLDSKSGSFSQSLLQQEGAAGRTWLLRLSTDELASFIGGSQTNSTATPFATLSVWHHIGVTYDGTTVQLYIDGVADGSAAQTGESETSAFRFGKHKNPDTINEEWNGQLDNIRIYNRALNAAEVRQLYNLSRTGYGDLLNRRRRVFKAPAAAGGNAMPMALQHYRQRRAG